VKHPSQLSISEFTYNLSDDKIAKFPLVNREDSKLLIYKNESIEETAFKNISNYLNSDYVLIFNSSKVIPARLKFLTDSKKEIELFCLEPNDVNCDISVGMAKHTSVRWNCLVGNLKQWKQDILSLENDNVILNARIIERNTTHVVIDFSWQNSILTFAEVLHYLGHIPIPPYLKRESDTLDKRRYQTVYASQNGSVAAPTAGLHFTETILSQLSEKNINQLSVTLHVGAGTFKPVKSDTLQGHDMHSEWIEIEKKMLEGLLKNSSKKIVAVGTTSLRTLESLYWMGVKLKHNPNYTLADLEIKQWEVYELNDATISKEKSLQVLLDWMAKHQLQKLICKTQILIAPPYSLKIVNALITNFHQPQSTLLLLISAVVGNNWKVVYDYALNHKFRFLSYGDSSLLFAK
jgi:S-adenosylmethionine:tRNA ribosyltransferase-isomerase